MEVEARVTVEPGGEAFGLGAAAILGDDVDLGRG